MISGQQVLRYLDQGLDTIRKDINRIDSELNKYSEALHANNRGQATSLKEIAKTRLDEISQGTFLGELEAADQRALGLLAERHIAHQDLEIDIAERNKKLQRLESDRESALLIVNEKAQATIDCEHKIQSELEIDEIYQEQLLDSRKLDNIAVEAEQKASQAELDRNEKGRDYEDNAFFNYLWKRNYGTSEYKANVVTRFLDKWVERQCDYDKYRVNYWTLLEIPKRLKKHAEDAREAADSSLNVLIGLETEKAAQAGLPGLQEKHAQALQLVDDLDLEIEQLENILHKLLQQRTEFLEARDVYMQEGLEVLSTALKTKSVYEINVAVSQTVNNQDDLVVRELAELREKNHDLEEELGDHRRLHEGKLRRLQELELVRRQFKQRRFDDMRSGFANDSLVSSMIEQFMNGMVNNNELWRVLQRHQRHQDVGAWPDFGSGGLGLPTRRRSPWHLPRGRGGLGGSFRLPRSGGFSSRGGFRTGGGF